MPSPMAFESPCDADLDAMPSFDGGRRRFCSQCMKSVHMLSEMTRDEALVFKCYDSDSDRARFTAHGSFEFADTAADAPPRESIEIRTIAFF